MMSPLYNLQQPGNLDKFAVLLERHVQVRCCVGCCMTASLWQPAHIDSLRALWQFHPSAPCRFEPASPPLHVPHSGTRLLASAATSCTYARVTCSPSCRCHPSATCWRRAGCSWWSGRWAVERLRLRLAVNSCSVEYNENRHPCQPVTCCSVRGASWRFSGRWGEETVAAASRGDIFGWPPFFTPLLFSLRTSLPTHT